MDTRRAFQAHVGSERRVGAEFCVLGAFMLLLGAGCFVLINPIPFVSGFKWAATGLGAVMTVAGAVYREQSSKRGRHGDAILGSDPRAFGQSELALAIKLSGGYGRNRILWAALILGSGTATGLASKSVIGGIGIAIFLFTAITILIENRSERATRHYLASLKASVGELAK